MIQWLAKTMRKKTKKKMRKTIKTMKMTPILPLVVRIMKGMRENMTKIVIVLGKMIQEMTKTKRTEMATTTAVL